MHVSALESQISISYTMTVLWKCKGETYQVLSSDVLEVAARGQLVRSNAAFGMLQLERTTKMCRIESSPEQSQHFCTQNR